MEKVEQTQLVLFQEDMKINKPNLLIKNIVHNQLLTINERKTYNILLRKLLNQELKDYQSNIVKTSISEITRELGTTKRTEIKNYLETLQSTRLRIIYTDHRGDTYKINSNLLSETGFQINKNKDTLIISFPSILATELLKYVGDHEDIGQYTKLDLIEMNKLKGKYSLPLFETFKSYLSSHNQQSKNFTISELRDITTTQEKYKTTAEFNRNVIKPALKEIREKTSIYIDLKDIENNSKSEKEPLYKFIIYKRPNQGPEVSLDLFKVIIFDLAKQGYKIKTEYKKKPYYFDKQKTFSDKSYNNQEKQKKLDAFLWLDQEDRTKRKDFAEKLWEHYYQQFFTDLDFTLDTLEIKDNEWNDLIKRIKKQMKTTSK